MSNYSFKFNDMTLLPNGQWNKGPASPEVLMLYCTFILFRRPDTGHTGAVICLDGDMFQQRSPGLAERNGEWDAEERVKGVALFQTVGARQWRSEGKESKNSYISLEKNLLCWFDTDIRIKPEVLLIKPVRKGGGLILLHKWTTQWKWTRCSTHSPLIWLWERKRWLM